MNNMGYSNSSLVDYTRLSPNNSGKRNHAIDTITIHCVCGQCSVETLGRIFAPTSRQASCNYGVGVDGRIGMYCEEKNRSWCTSSSSNDNRAVTIEVASDKNEPCAVKDTVYESLINLVTDICKRNGIKKLLWKGDKSLIGQIDKQNMTVHRWFAKKSCPGEWLYSRHGEIAKLVNERLGATAVSKPISTGKTNGSLGVGDSVTIVSGGTQYNGKSINSAYLSKVYKVSEINGDRAVLTLGNVVMYAVNTSNLREVGSVDSGVATSSFLVKITANVLNVRSGPGTSNKINTTVKNGGVYRIVEVSGDWGRLKSGVGWINLDYTRRM